MLRLNKSEDFSQWVARVVKHEIAEFNKLVTNGEDVETALDLYSKNITTKITHAIIIELKNSVICHHDITESKKSYNNIYLSKTKRPGDHVED